MLGALNFEIIRRQSNRSATPLSSDRIPNRLMQIKSEGIAKFIRFRVVRRLMTLSECKKRILSEIHPVGMRVIRLGDG